MLINRLLVRPNSVVMPSLPRLGALESHGQEVNAIGGRLLLRSNARAISVSVKGV